MNFELPVIYNDLGSLHKRLVREQSAQEQDDLCYLCKASLTGPPSQEILNKPIDRNLFPMGFFNYPVHLQHCHKTGLTEGAVHAQCNAVMWQ